MPHRTNMVLSDDAWEMLQQIPKGRRSEVVSKAVVTDLTLRRRREAAVSMDKRRAGKQPMQGSSEQWIREDRDNH